MDSVTALKSIGTRIAQPEALSLSPLHGHRLRNSLESSAQRWRKLLLRCCARACGLPPMLVASLGGPSMLQHWAIHRMRGLAGSNLHCHTAQTSCISKFLFSHAPRVTSALIAAAPRPVPASLPSSYLSPSTSFPLPETGPHIHSPSPTLNPKPRTRHSLNLQDSEHRH